MLPNQTILRIPRAVKTLCRLAAAATLALGASVASHAAGGELLDIELPSMRTPIDAVRVAGRAPESAESVAVQVESVGQTEQPLTRARVRESLAMARLANLVSPGGELGDTTEVLQAREDFNALQTEVMEAEYRTAALRLQQEQVAVLLTQAQGYSAPDSSTAVQASVEVVVVPSNKAYELLFEGGPAADVPDKGAPAAEPQGVILMLVNERASD